MFNSASSPVSAFSATVAGEVAKVPPDSTIARYSGPSGLDLEALARAIAAFPEDDRRAVLERVAVCFGSATSSALESAVLCVPGGNPVPTSMRSALDGLPTRNAAAANAAPVMGAVPSGRAAFAAPGLPLQDIRAFAARIVDAIRQGPGATAASCRERANRAADVFGAAFRRKLIQYLQDTSGGVEATSASGQAASGSAAPALSGGATTAFEQLNRMLFASDVEPLRMLAEQALSASKSTADPAAREAAMQAALSQAESMGRRFFEAAYAAAAGSLKRPVDDESARHPESREADDSVSGKRGRPEMTRAFSPHRADLIYGLSDARRKLVRQLLPGSNPRTSPAIANTYLDLLTKGTIDGRRVSGVRGAEPTLKRLPIETDEVSEAESVAALVYAPGNVQAIANAVRDADPEHYDKAYDRMIRRNIGLMKAPGAGSVPGKYDYVRQSLLSDQRRSLGYAYDMRETARACKAAIAANFIPGEDGCVHFALDDIDMNAVVKKRKDSAGNGAGESVTAKELRAAYRLALLYPDDFDRHVQFYRNGQPCPPPWRSDPALWSGYKPKLESKFGGVLKPGPAVP